MTIAEYLDSIKTRLLTDPVVVIFHIIQERATSTDGHLRARLTLTNGSFLEFSEYVQRSTGVQVAVITYSYHWADDAGNLVRRWDNTPHFPNLPGFPHHIHNGRTNEVSSGQPINIFDVLDEITRSLT